MKRRGLGPYTIMAAVAASSACVGLAPEGAAPEFVPPEVEATVVDVCGDGVERADDFFAESHCKGAEPAYDRLFDDTVVRRLDIVIDADWYAATLDDLTDLLGNSSGPGGGGPGGGGPGGGGPGGGAVVDLEEEPMWAPVAVSYEGLTFRSVGMRYKGNSSLRSSWQSGIHKLPFRLTFDKYEDADPLTDDQRFFGFKKMTFSPGYMDASFLRDKLAADLFRDAGVPAARGAFVEVTLDSGAGPTSMGLYAIIEDPSNKMLEAQFGDDTGNLYKPEGDGAYLATFDPDAFEKKNNEDDPDTTDVEAFIQALNDDDADTETWRANLEATFDVDGFLVMLAVSQTIVNWDAYGFMNHNYYLYADPAEGGRLRWIPWDLNEAFIAGRRAGSDEVMLDSVGEQWPLIRRLLDDEVYRARYQQALSDVLAGVFPLEDLHERIETHRALLQPYAAAERSPYTHLTSPFAFDAAYDDPVSGLHAHLDARHTAVLEALAED